jgi:hypothetical protein
MQGIQLFEYKTLLESLNKLKEREYFHLPEEQSEIVLQKENRLKEIYSNYQLSLEQVSACIRQFEQHKNAIRKLMKDNKQYQRHTRKKELRNA